MKQYLSHTFIVIVLLLTAGCPTGQAVPGGTTADLTLQRDVTQMIMRFEEAIDANCSQRKIVNTVQADPKTPIERWTVDRCGKLVDYEVRYAASNRGGTDFAVSSTENIDVEKANHIR